MCGWQYFNPEDFHGKERDMSSHQNNYATLTGSETISEKRIFTLEDPDNKKYVRTMFEVTNLGVCLVVKRLNVVTQEFDPITCAIFTWSEINNDVGTK
jgi:hypothetical protein